MNDFFEPFLWSLLRTTCWLIIAAAVTSGLLWCLRASSPRTHRIGRLLTLLVGWSFLQMPIAVHWYAAVETNALPSLATFELPQLPLASVTPVGKVKKPAQAIPVAPTPTLASEPTEPPIGWPTILFCSWLGGMVLGGRGLGFWLRAIRATVAEGNDGKRGMG